MSAAPASAREATLLLTPAAVATSSNRTRPLVRRLAIGVTDQILRDPKPVSCPRSVVGPPVYYGGSKAAGGHRRRSMAIRHGWTVADLELFPQPLDDTRYEIVDGELYVSKQPSWEHQFT